MTGKEKCSQLRAIRKRIAEANHIRMDFPDCNHQGPCAGTCPFCDKELRSLTRKLARKARLMALLGKKVVLKDLCAGWVNGPSECNFSTNEKELNEDNDRQG